MKLKIIIGIVLVLLGIGLYTYNDMHLRPEREALELLTEAKMIFERGDKDSINQSIGILTKAIAKYPNSHSTPEVYYYIGLSYEKMGLYRLAYLKYSYVIKNNSPFLTSSLKKEILVRLAHINILKQQSEEGLSQLYTLLQENYSNELRSRIYSELGHSYLKIGEYKRSKRMFDIALSEYGGNEEALVGKARAFKRMGYDSEAYDLYEYFLKYYGAVSQYTKDVRCAYKNQAYMSGLGAFRRGNYTGAISFFNRVIANFPGEKISENAYYWMGETYFALNKFDTAVAYFDKVLSNSFYHKDQDAQVKKGYAYFMNKKFDLAAREFQTYLRNYPNGKYASVAKEWKSMSTKELLYRIEEKKLPDLKEGDMKAPEENKQKSDVPKDEEDEEVAGDYYGDETENGIELENVAEL